MTRLLAPTLALAALMLAGCGAHPAMKAPVTRQAQSVQARYLVFYISASATTPAPAGAAHAFATATIKGGGLFPKTDTPITITATFKSVGGKVTVSFTRDGKPLADKDMGFYFQQFQNNLIMGGELPAGTKEAIEEILKWAKAKEV